jgi:hypothetical protein
LLTGDPSHWQKQVLAKGERLEEDLISQWSLKTDRSSNTISDKVYFKFTVIERDKEGHIILIKGDYTKRK